MPPETPQEISNDDLAELIKSVLGDMGKLYGDLASKLDGLARQLAGWSDHLPTLLRAAEVTDERLAAAEADLGRLRDLAEQAEKFLHNPIGAYKAARLGKIKVPDVPA